MLRHRTLVIALVAVGALTACTASTIDGTGSTSGSPSSSAPSSSATGGATPGALPAQPAADFSDCSSDFNLDSLSFPAGRRDRLSFDCATIDVPLDYARPTKGTVSLQLVKVHDSANTDPTGSLLVNPGGPGGSGVELGVSLSAQVSDDVLSHFDLIGFDPRGVGLSSPISCISDAQKDVLNAASPNVLTAAGAAQAKQLSKSVADACTAKYGSSLAQFNTVQTARDMDRIRQAVGDDRMNYLGFSYGTELGAQYAHLFPGRIRVAVLDGAVDPLTDDIASFAAQLKGFESSFDQFAASCRKTAACATIGDPRQAVYRLAAMATRSPIPSSKAGETRRATSALVYTGVLSALYSSSLWTNLGEAITSGLAGDSAGILALADRYNERSDDGKYSNISDANTTIGCNDSEPGPTDAVIRATAVSWTKQFPIFGASSAPALYSCQQWQPVRTPPALPTARSAKTVLVVGNLNDPATPYQGAKDLTATLGNAELLTWDGEGHTSYLQGSACIDRYVDAYLVRGTLPPKNRTCT